MHARKKRKRPLRLVEVYGAAKMIAGAWENAVQMGERLRDNDVQVGWRARGATRRR